MANTKNNFKLNNEYIVIGDPTILINMGWGGNGTERN